MKKFFDSLLVGEVELTLQQRKQGRSLLAAAKCGCVGVRRRVRLRAQHCTYSIRLLALARSLHHNTLASESAFQHIDAVESDKERANSAGVARGLALSEDGENNIV
jgi:hypothetical protein